jgi:hypothetical protein
MVFKLFGLQRLLDDLFDDGWLGTAVAIDL